MFTSLGLVYGAGQVLTGLHLLYVDDSEDERARFALWFALLGARVTDVATADAAFEALTAVDPDVLVSDLALSGRGGLELVARVRSASADGRELIPAVAVAGAATAEVHDEAARRGFQAVVAKPYDVFSLTAALVQVAPMIALYRDVRTGSRANRQRAHEQRMELSARRVELEEQRARVQALRAELTVRRIVPPR